jgi:hypothetical protein
VSDGGNPLSGKVEVYASHRWGNRGRSRLMRKASLALLLASGILIACGGDDDDDPVASPRLESRHEPTCAGYAQRLRACDLMTEGKFTCSDPATPTEECVFDCLTTASCSLLAQHRCVDTPPALGRCLARCEYFTCDEDYLIPLLWVCDHALDCSDVFEDCVDGSDEAGCPTFTCSDQELIPEQWVCDFDQDCLDGGDEVGCDHYVCEINGEELPGEWRCDLEDDCLDGADEVGCAQLLCR